MSYKDQSINLSYAAPIFSTSYELKLALDSLSIRLIQLFNCPI
jgi:hypothetical protein